MDIKSGNWLSHLKDLPDDIDGYKTCTYLIALEGWRRGLKLTFRIRSGSAIPPSVQILLSNDNRTHTFTVSRGDKVTEEARNICMQKPLTYKYLRENNIPIPEGDNFSSEVSNEEILNYAEQLGYPLVLKPTDGASGRGVFTDITNGSELMNALTHVREKLGFKEVIVERFIKGEDYRVYVIDDKVVGAYKRVSANVIGDGTKTIRELIKIKNNIRRKNPFIRSRMIKIDKNMREFLREQNLTLDSIPKKGDRIYLRPQGERISERDPIDITDELAEEIRETAVQAMKSIPGLTHCDVDMLIDAKTGKGYVNEINSRPQISNHLFPLEGMARDVPKEIIDFYFPETKDGYRNDTYYFDFEPVYQAFRNKSIRELTIPDLPKNHTLAQYRITGKLKNVGYENWVRRQAVRENLHGYVRRLKSEEVLIVVSGSKRNMKNFKDIINNSSPSKARVDDIKEEDMISGPIKVGFHVIIDKEKNVKRNVIKKELRKLKERIENYENEQEKFLNSTSWKITKPVRFIGKLFKK